MAVKRHMRVVAGVLVVLLGGVLAAAAQTPQARIDAALARATDAGIPVALLQSKIAEGRAKGVSLDRIAAAVERRGVALEHARDVLRGPREVDQAGLGIAADAVEAGIGDAALAAVAESAPRDRRAVAIAVLTELVSRGRSQETALNQVRDALKKGPEALANLPAQAGAAPGSRGGGAANRPEEAGANGRGNAAPPAAVPAPGGETQPARPGGPPSSPGRPDSAGRGRGRG
jgi:hypothetical protein